MGQTQRAAKVDVGREAFFEQVRQMATELESAEFFARLECLIDQVRGDLDLIPDPVLRAELRDMFREVIDYALSLKMGDVFLGQAAQG